MIDDSPIGIHGKMGVGRELFGNKYVCTKNIIYARLLNHEIVIEDMELQYHGVFMKLKNLL